jgi:hypothetical protein
MIQLLRGRSSVFASVVHDHEYFSIDASRVIEVTDALTTLAAQRAALAAEPGGEPQGGVGVPLN